MNNYAVKNASGTYDIFQNGSKISTGTASTLANYGLSETNLGASSSSSNPTPPAPPANTNTTPIPDSYYSNYAAGVGSGALTPEQAFNDLNGYILSGKYGGSVDTSKLFPQGQSYFNGQGQKVQFDPSGTGKMVPVTPGAPTGGPSAPPLTTVPQNVPAPSTNGTYTPPNGTAGATADQFNTSLATTLATQQKQLDDALASQTKAYQDKIDALTKQKQEAEQLQEAGLVSENSLVAKETADKQAAIEREQQQFTENYNARQALVGRLETLLTTGQSIIEGMKTTTGLASIMNPRLTETMSNVQAEAGVITATLSAYSDQIGLAQSQLKTSTDAITSLYSDQISYWKSVTDFYDSKGKEVDTEIAGLSKDQKTYIDAQIQTLQDNINTTKSAQQAIEKAMLDPTTALAYAKAGITLNDTPAQMNQKLATYEEAQQNAWGAPKLLGGDYIQTNKITGETRTVVSNIPTAPTAATVGSALSDAKDAIAKGADPNKVKQAFLASHPANAADWNAFFTDADGNAATYPAPPAPAKSGLFGLGFLGL